METLMNPNINLGSRAQCTHDAICARIFEILSTRMNGVYNPTAEQRRSIKGRVNSIFPRKRGRWYPERQNRMLRTFFRNPLRVSGEQLKSLFRHERTSSASQGFGTIFRVFSWSLTKDAIYCMIDHLSKCGKTFEELRLWRAMINEERDGPLAFITVRYISCCDAQQIRRDGNRIVDIVKNENPFVGVLAQFLEAVKAIQPHIVVPFRCFLFPREMTEILAQQDDSLFRCLNAVLLEFFGVKSLINRYDDRNIESSTIEELQCLAFQPQFQKPTFESSTNPSKKVLDELKTLFLDMEMHHKHSTVHETTEPLSKLDWVATRCLATPRAYNPNKNNDLDHRTLLVLFDISTFPFDRTCRVPYWMSKDSGAKLLTETISGMAQLEGTTPPCFELFPYYSAVPRPDPDDHERQIVGCLVPQ
ncbi:hypothetical protein M426DRAFT_150376 [Hypoxylon sp. CI-4A]|nr:hypothetical protein M426DRAFT_150376 [Hypoxylon sp. CI-4A]